MQETQFREEVKKHILGEDRNGNLLVDFTSLNQVLGNNRFGNILKELDSYIIESDKERLAKETEYSVEDCIFIDAAISSIRRYCIGANIYTVDRIGTVSKIATFDLSKQKRN